MQWRQKVWLPSEHILYRYHYDNASSHTSFETQFTITLQLETDILTHPPYSPDLEQCDFPLFPRLKSELRRQSFKSVLALRTAVNQTFGSYKPDWYDRCSIDGFTDTRKKLVRFGANLAPREKLKSLYHYINLRICPLKKSYFLMK